VFLVGSVKEQQEQRREVSVHPVPLRDATRLAMAAAVAAAATAGAGGGDDGCQGDGLGQ